MPNRPEDLLFPYDTIRLPKTTLSQICREYGLEVERDIVASYNAAIWRHINATNDQSPLSRVLHEAFAGQTAVVWYKPDRADAVRQAAAMLREGRTNYFEGRIVLDAADMEEERAYVVGACSATLAGEHVDIVRLRTRASRMRVTDGIEVDWIPTIVMATMILNVDRGYIELRSSSSMVPRLLERVEPLIGIPATEMQPELIAPFAEDVEHVADLLDGRAVRTDSKPDAFLRKITPEQIEAIMRILDAVSMSIAEPSGDALVEVIEEERESLVGDIDLTTVPLSVLMLAGFNQIGLTADVGRDVRDGALYQAVRDNMHHHGGFIQFPVTEGDGAERWHTIRLGATTNSIAFSTKATEAAIKKVRNVLLGYD